MASVQLPRLTKEAAEFWNGTTPRAQAQILANVYCANCHGATSIEDARGSLKRGVLLEGKYERRGEMSRALSRVRKNKSIEEQQ